MLKAITKDNIKVGTTLYLVPASCGRFDKPKEIVITKIGRKYAYYGDRDSRICLDTMHHENDFRGIRPSLWDSKSAYEEALNQHRVITECRESLSSSNPTKRKKLTYDKAVRILAILNED